MVSPSSDQVQMSQMRISSVGCLPEGRMSHQMRVGSLTMPVSLRISSISFQSFQLSKTSGRPERGRSPMMIGRKAFSPVSWPSQKGEEVESARRCGMK